MVDLEELGAPATLGTWTEDLEFSGALYYLSAKDPPRYFQVTVPLPRLKEYFKLVEDIPGSEDWGYNAVFQRDIDWERVRVELVHGYLKRPEKHKFFPPITVALLPYNASSNRVLSQYPKKLKREETDKEVTEDLGGGIVIRQLKGRTIGLIKWDTATIAAVAIDGQHRLSALIEMADGAAAIRSNPMEIRIPVTVLVFPEGPGIDLIKIVREVFIDINKNARPPSTARQLVLDDTDSIAILARNLIQDQDNPDGLPYEIVDWRQDEVRPKGENQLTSLKILHDILGNMIDLSGYEAAFTAAGITPYIDGVPPTPPQLKVLIEAFAVREKEPVLAVLRTLEPFRKFTQKLQELTSSDGTPETEQKRFFKEYLFKSQAARERFRQNLEARTYDTSAVIDGPLGELSQLKAEYGGDDCLLFTSIGQRGIFSVWDRVRVILGSDKSQKDCALEYGGFLNQLIGKGFLRADYSAHAAEGADTFRVWEGLCLRKGRIASSQKSVKRIGSLVVIAAIALKDSEWPLPDDFDGAEYGEVDISEPLMEIESAYKDEEVRLRESRGEEADDDEQLTKAARARMTAILTALRTA